MIVLNENFWTNRYQKNETGWDLGDISTPLKNYFDQLTNKEIAILIPGAGNAHEAEYLFKKGFTNITIIDISPEPLKNIKERMYINRLKRAYILYNHFVEGNKILCSPEFGSRENLKKYKYDEPIVWLINQEQNRKKIENELVFENFKNIKQKPICYMFHSILDINMLAYYKYMFHFPENFGLRLINCFKETILEPKDQVLLSILKEKIEEEKLIPLKTVAIKLKVKEFSNRLSLDNDILNKQLIKTISTEKLAEYYDNVLAKMHEQCEQLTMLKDTADLVRREIIDRNDAASV